MRWELRATFDVTELEADGIGDTLMALLPAEAEINLEAAPEDPDTVPEASLFAAGGLVSP